MKPITIKYNPIKWLRFAFAGKGKIPESWEEITPKQIITIGSTANRGISDVEFLTVLTGLPKFLIKRLSNYDRFQISENLIFISASKMHHAFVLPYVKVNHVKYYTPKPKLKRMSFSQFILTDTYFGSYQNQNNDNDLHNFIAALCLVSHHNFNEDIVERNAPKMAKLKPETKEALLINYMLIKGWLTKAYPLLFPDPEKNDDTQNKSEEEQPVFDCTAWIKIFDGMLGENIAERDKYLQLPCNEAFRFLSNRIKQNIKRKK